MEREIADFSLVHAMLLDEWLVGNNADVKPEFAYNGEDIWEPLAARILDGMERIGGIPVRYLSDDDFSEIYFAVTGVNAE